eukprot:1268391-Amphidinium_carterae.1
MKDRILALLFCLQNERAQATLRSSWIWFTVEQGGCVLQPLLQVDSSQFVPRSYLNQSPVMRTCCLLANLHSILPSLDTALGTRIWFTVAMAGPYLWQSSSWNVNLMVEVPQRNPQQLCKCLETTSPACISNDMRLFEEKAIDYASHGGLARLHHNECTMLRTTCNRQVIISRQPSKMLPRFSLRSRFRLLSTLGTVSRTRVNHEGRDATRLLEVTLRCCKALGGNSQNHVAAEPFCSSQQPSSPGIDRLVLHTMIVTKYATG